METRVWKNGKRSKRKMGTESSKNWGGAKEAEAIIVELSISIKDYDRNKIWKEWHKSFD